MLNSRSLSLFFFLNAIGVNIALACSPDMRPQAEIIANRFKYSNEVFVAELLKVERSLTSDDRLKVVKEDVAFKIVRILKGKKRPGDVYKTVTTIRGDYLSHCNNGPISAVNDPESHSFPPDETAFPSTWIIYTSKSSPNELRYPSRPIFLNNPNNDIQVLESESIIPKQ